MTATAARGRPATISPTSPALEVRGLSRRFGDHEVIRKLDLIVREGERLALHGPNGSGKTTILRCLAGSLQPSGGEAFIGGFPVGSIGARRLTALSLSQERSFYMRLSGRDNLIFFARLRALSRGQARRVVSELEEELEISEILAERADRCSTGMLQQLGFARALLLDPPVLLLDEPTRSLDSAAVDRLWAALGRRPRTAVLLATHLEQDLERCESSIELPV